MAVLQVFRFGKADAELFRHLLGDRVPADRNRPDEDPVAVGNHQVRTASADVEDQRAFIVAQLRALRGVEQCHRRNLHGEDFLAGVFDHIGIADNLVGLHRNKQRFVLLMLFGDFDCAAVFLHLTAVVLPGVADQLVIPDHLAHRVRNRLARLILDDARDCVLIAEQGGQAAQAREGGLSRQRQPDLPGGEAVLRNHLQIGLGKGGIVPLLLLEFPEREFPENNSSAGRENEFGHLQAVAADVNR
ncbi:hypothetical protein SDC9_154839 [bioreactor metagenome]|uniref:Uncharacterized protein n=1 Tax=bioreactor metagenome TaxID=1076179 RepID=A0A645EZT8_9ZZZZ